MSDSFNGSFIKRDELPQEDFVRVRARHIGYLTKLINRVTEFLNSLNNDLNEIENKIEKTLTNIDIVTSEYCSTLSQNEVAKEIEILREQQAKVLTIKASIHEYCSKELATISIEKPQNVLTSKDFETKSHKSSKSSKSSSSGRSKSSSGRSKSSSRTSLRYIVESKAKIERAKLITADIEQKSQRKLKLIEKRKFLELEEEQLKLLNEIDEAKTGIKIAEIEDQITMLYSEPVVEDSVKEEAKRDYRLSLLLSSNNDIKTNLFQHQHHTVTQVSQSNVNPTVQNPNHHDNSHTVAQSSLADNRYILQSSHHHDNSHTVAQRSLADNRHIQQSSNYYENSHLNKPNVNLTEQNSSYYDNSFTVMQADSRPFISNSRRSNISHIVNQPRVSNNCKLLNQSHPHQDGYASTHSFVINNRPIVHSYRHQDNSHTVPQNAVTSNISSEVPHHHQLDRNNDVAQPTHSDQSESVDAFIDNFIDGQETKLPSYLFEKVNLNFSLQQELESRSLPPVQLIIFNGDPTHWPEFIENFKSRVHLKPTFNDNIRMERLLSVLEGDAKKLVESIGCNSLFYATALKGLKRNFGNPLVVSHMKIKSILEKPQILHNDRDALRQFHQKLKSTITWLDSMGYTSAITSSENLTKAVTRLPHRLRQSFYKSMKYKVSIETMTLRDFEK